MIKYIKSVLWRVAKRLSYTEDARCLKVKKAELLQRVVTPAVTHMALQKRKETDLKDVHLHSTENKTFREAHSLICTVKLAVIFYP